MLLVCAILWVVYLVGFNIFLSSDLLPRLAAPHPERTVLSWERAWTVFPGLVHVRGFELRSHTRGIVWRLEVDRARTLVNLLALPFRSFDALSVRARGVEWELDKAETVLQRKKKKKPGFRIRIRRSGVDGIRSLALYGLTLEGPMRAGGGIDTRARGPLSVSGIRLKMDGGTLRQGEEDLVTDFDLAVQGSIDRHVPREHREEGLLPFLVARVQINGDVADLAILDQLLRGTHFVSFGGGSGRLDADLRLTRGVVEPESRLVTEEATYTVDYLGYHATGTGRIVGFSAANKASHELLRFDLDHFDLAAGEDATPYLIGSGLTVSLRGEEGLPLIGKQKALDIVVDLPEAEVPDMSAYNRNLPQKAGVRIISGSGRVQAHLELSQRTGKGRGSVDLSAGGMVVDLGDRRIVGDLGVHSRGEVVDLAARVLDPSGTRVEFRNAGVFFDDAEAEGGSSEQAGVADWWGVVAIPKGRLNLTKPMAIGADFTIEAESAAPIFALFAKTQKKAEKLERRLKTEDLTGSGRVEVGDGWVGLPGLVVEAGKATVRADLCLVESDMHGLIHGKYGILAVAAELHGHKETLHVTSPKRWFENNRKSFTCGQ